LSPQQATVPSVLSPQLWEPPALTWVNGPAGGVAWPERLSPQQATVPSVLSPQVCENPALTWVNAPAGGVASP
jgi:hypothetical protein